jgi:hypothetical protein
MNNRNLHSAGSDEDTVFQGIPGVFLGIIWYLFVLKPVPTLRRLKLRRSNCTYTLCLYPIIPTETHMTCDTSNLKLVLHGRHYLLPFFSDFVLQLLHMVFCPCSVFMSCFSLGSDLWWMRIYKIWLPEIETGENQNSGMCCGNFMRI